MFSDIRTMIEARRHDKDDEGGFTLIELLIVVVVLGILAAIVVFAVQNLTGESAKTACRADAKTVEVAQEVKKARDGAYAGTVAALVPTYIRSAPSSTRYAITTDTSGVVKVTTAAVTTATDHNDPSNPCGSAV